VAAEPTTQPAPKVGRSLGMAVGLFTSPCVFLVYYDFPYFLYPHYLITPMGLAGLAASVILGLVAAKLARGPRLGPTAVGLLASVAPGVYIGLEVANRVPSDAAAAAMMIGALASVAIGGGVGLGVGILAQREGRRAPWLGSAALGLALGASIGIYLTSVVFQPMVANAKLINPLVGGAIGLAVGLAVARGGRAKPWLGRASLGLAVGSSTGIWAFHDIHSVEGMYRQWAVWTVWAALGGAAGLAWAGRSGVGRLRPTAAGLAVGACTGASFGLLTCSSTTCFQETAMRWGLIGSLAGGVLGVAIGALGYRTRLSWAALGLAVGALLGDYAFTFTNTAHYQSSLDASELVGYVIVGLFGLAVGWLAADAGERPAAFGLAFGGWIGSWAGTQAAYYAIVPGGADRGGMVGMMAGGLIGLAISLQAGRHRFGTTALSMVAGAFIGARLGDPSGQSAIHGIVGMAIGGCLGLILSSRGERAVIASVPGLAVGAVIGAWAGAAVLAEFSVSASPAATSLICMTAGGLAGLMYVHGSRLIQAGRILSSARRMRQVSLPLWQDARLDRVTCLSRWLASLAAAHGSGGSETLRERYAEEFDSTLSMITCPHAPLRRLRCAISILIGALTLRIEIEDDEDNAS
jgi:hypothetical protein